METNGQTDTAIAKALTELANATWASIDQTNRTRLKVMTPSTGGELSLEWDPKCTDEEFATYLSKELGRREKVLKGVLAQNMDNKIGVKEAKQ